MKERWFNEAEYSSAAVGARLSTDAASIRPSTGDAIWNSLFWSGCETVAGKIGSKLSGRQK
ncbi:unnamed protein product [Sphenostylis stenocarpa]|uniref:Uncharacterized protein n=1 Tax=Sphenostylis stenocarpa TaxID=92480 RepID=A0AA86RUS1_9FABA|nr:unnamed protein product [Sphenostylis stenocarpa]